MATIVFLALAIASSLAWHTKVNRYLAAVAGATATTLLAFEVVLFLYFGRTGIFGPIALAILALIAALLAALLGLPFRRRRLAAANSH
jgi:hypothetical protein